MGETPFYFPNGGYSLFGVLHEPAADSDHPAFVFCHPFGEEKLWAHRVFVGFARALAARGYPVLRFDSMGSGDSHGRFQDASLTTALADVRAAIEEVRRRTRRHRVSLLGLRFGATLASLVAEEVSDLDRLVLWAPIIDGARYMQDLLRINLTTQMAVYREIRRDREALVAAMRSGETVNVDGYEMGLAMFDSVSALKLAANPKRCIAPCLITQLDRQLARPAPELVQLASGYANVTFNLVQEEPFWREIARFYDRAPLLDAETLRWLEGPSPVESAAPQ